MLVNVNETNKANKIKIWFIHRSKEKHLLKSDFFSTKERMFVMFVIPNKKRSNILFYFVKNENIFIVTKENKQNILAWVRIIHILNRNWTCWMIMKVHFNNTKFNSLSMSDHGAWSYLHGGGQNITWLIDWSNGLIIFIRLQIQQFKKRFSKIGKTFWF